METRKSVRVQTESYPSQRFKSKGDFDFKLKLSLRPLTEFGPGTGSQVTLAAVADPGSSPSSIMILQVTDSDTNLNATIMALARGSSWPSWNFMMTRTIRVTDVTGGGPAKTRCSESLISESRRPWRSLIS
jgi:hypothetical protein